MNTISVEKTTPRMRCIKAAAHELNISEYALRRWVKRGLVPAVYTGRKALVNLDNVVDFLRGGE